MADTALTVKFASTREQNPKRAVLSLKKQFGGGAPAAVFFFCGTNFDLKALGKNLQDSFSCPIVGCTTAGEFSVLSGYGNNSLVAVAVTSSRFCIKTYLLKDLDTFSLSQGKTLENVFADDFPEQPHGVNNRFGLLLIDGMSFREEHVIGTLSASLGHLPIIGGSAGDNLEFSKTFVYSKGEFHSNAATLTVVETSHPFKIFQTQHFKPTGKKLVITESIPKERLVSEINGFPAANEYARLVGLNQNELSSDVFSLYPVMLKIDGIYYVRSIQRVNEDGSLTFYCAIDTGLVLTIGTGENIIEETKNALATIAGEVGNVKLLIGCDCILRKLELESGNLQEKMAGVLKEYNSIGFSTYGEQFKGLHINQTLTGIMLGE